MEYPIFIDEKEDDVRNNTAADQAKHRLYMHHFFCNRNANKSAEKQDVAS